MDNSGKLKAGHPTKFFHHLLGLVDATKGLTEHQVRVLTEEGRIVKEVRGKEKE